MPKITPIKGGFSVQHSTRETWGVDDFTHQCPTSGDKFEHGGKCPHCGDTLEPIEDERTEPQQMFRNKHFSKRDYEATNIVACLATVAPNENWVPTTHEELNAMLRSPLRALWIESGVQYYGYL